MVRQALHRILGGTLLSRPDGKRAVYGQAPLAWPVYVPAPDRQGVSE
jgi:hypothetical protein